MNATRFSYFADENIHPAVIAFLRHSGSSVTTSAEALLNGAPDEKILRFAHERDQVVLTHDSDFGLLAIAAGQPLTGILYLRPGHIQAAFTIRTIEAVFNSSIDPQPPFLMVATQRNSVVRLRLRQL